LNESQILSNYLRGCPLSGYGGARVARKIPAPVLRWGIAATGLVMAGLFFAKG
jgi:hypothetical protein